MTRRRDLADVVPEIRELRWKVALGLRARPTSWDIELLDVEGIARLVWELQALDDPLAHALASDYERLATELKTDLETPGEQELVTRYARGEIGDRTVRYILDIESFELIDLCVRHGVPPMCGALVPDKD